jgi:hypothetical protein
MRENSGTVRLIERSWQHEREGRNVRMGPASGPETQAEDGHTPQVNSQDDAPLCFRPFEGYYSYRASRRQDLPGQCEIILEGQCASRARLRITQCKRST